MVVLMETKELEQLLCDYFAAGEEIAVNARWLQNKLQLQEKMKGHIKELIHKNELLQSLVAISDYDCPKYRLNIKG